MKSALLFLALCSTITCVASSLEELLRPRVSASQLSGEDANKAWRQVVDAFHKNDMVKAVELGKLFLSSGDLKTSAFQLLGVKVMIGLAGGAQSGAMFENREDQE